jgi:hypothetical protein
VAVIIGNAHSLGKADSGRTEAPIGVLPPVRRRGWSVFAEQHG